MSKMLKICIILFFALRASYTLETIPVFLIDNGLLDGILKPQDNPTIQIDKDELASIMDAVQGNSACIIFFIEDQFSMVDVSKKDNMGTPFVNLNTAFKNKKVKQFHRVVDPYPYFKTRFPPYDFNTFHIRSTTTKLRLEENYKFMYVFFEDDVNESRTQQLRRHDAIIREVLFVVKQLAEGPVTAIYTGKINPVDVSSTISYDFAPREGKPLQVASSDEQDVCRGKWEHQKCRGNEIFQFCGATITDAHAGTLDVIPKGCRVDEAKESKDLIYIIKVITDEDHSYQIKWEIGRVWTPDKNLMGYKIYRISVLDENGTFLGKEEVSNLWEEFATKVELRPHTVDKNPNSTGPFNSLDLFKFVIGINASDGKDYIRQNLPISRSSLLRSGSDSKAGEGTETFITAGILSGLLVMLIFVGILSWGIMNLMSVQTNTRYDNPDSKPLFDPDRVGE